MHVLKAKMPSRTRIWAWEATAGGMQHLGGAVRRSPGPRGTAPQQPASGRVPPRRAIPNPVSSAMS